jgi:hypothetical protein
MLSPYGWNSRASLKDGLASLSAFAIIAGLDYLLASFSNCFFQGLANDGKNSWIIYFRNDVADI